MNNIVYDEFGEFLEDEFGEVIAPVTSDEELLQAVARLASTQSIAATELLRRFGAHLFARFVRLYPIFFDANASALEFLEQVGSRVHDELNTLTPNMRFPAIDSRRLAAHQLELVYRSDRSMADLAEGMIRGCADYFGEALALRREELPARTGQAVRFLLTFGAG